MTIAVAGILIGVVVPPFQAMVRRGEMADTANDMTMAITFARSEAARVGGGVQMQAVDAADTANEWGPGWQVVAPGGTVLQLFARAKVGMSINGTDGVAAITFNGRGLPNQNLTIDMCHPGTGLRIAMSAVGRPATTHLTEGDCP